MQIWGLTPTQSRGCTVHCVWELTDGLQYVMKRHIMSTLYAQVLFISGWLLSPDILMDPLLPSFLSFQSKLKKKLKTKTNMTNLTIFTPWCGPNRTELLIGFGLSPSTLKHLIQSSPLNTEKRNGRPIMKEHEKRYLNSSGQTRVTHCPEVPPPRQPFPSGQTELVCHPILDSQITDFFFFPLHPECIFLYSYQ